jgi:hypothetical protein
VLAEIYDLKPGELPGAKKLGNKLRAFRGRSCGGKALDDRGDDGHGVKVWRVVDLSRQSGSAGSSGSDTAILTRDEGTENSVDMCTHAQEVVGGADPENPADPDSGSNGPHRGGHSLNGHAANNGRPNPDVIHRIAGCTGREWWQSRIDGVRYCSICSPCRDRAALVAEGSQ